VPSGLAVGLALKELRYAETSRRFAPGRLGVPAKRVPRSPRVWFVVIRLWVIIDAAAYTTCRIDVMHFLLHDSCIEAATRAHEFKRRANWRKRPPVGALTESGPSAF
jgi:hypothetical protein